MPTASTNPPKVYRWPTGKSKHTVSWAQQKANVAARHPAAPVAPAAPAAPIAPVAPAAPLAAPVDPAYQAAMSGATRTRDTSLAALQQQRTSGATNYGFSVREDPVTGAVTGITFDPNNPFSKAMLLKKTYDQNRARTAQAIGSTGGLYSGGFQKAQDLVNIGQLGAEDSLQKSLLSFLAQNTQAKFNAGTRYFQDVSKAEADRTDRIAENPLYEPDSAIASASAAAGTSTPPPAKTHKPKPKRPPNIATGVGSTRKPRVKTYTTGVRTP